MARLLQACVQDFRALVENILNSRRWPPPYGLVPCVIGAESALPQRIDDLTNGYGRNDVNSSSRLAELFGVDLSILWGTPVSKRTRGECYKNVREETEVIKKRLLAYNPFKGELPDKEALLVYQGEKPPTENTAKDMFGSEQRIVEIDKPRPSWFTADLRKRWRNLKPFVYNKPEE